MYYFYLIQSPFGRAGFGITQDPKRRNQQYCSHMGGIANMQLYGGLKTHATALEETIKTQYIDNIWIIDDWKTEWLNETVPMSQLKSYVDELIKERHFRVKFLTDEYNFQQELGN
jgi:predicted GIY-YIG superfamily endonuclease